MVDGDAGEIKVVFTGDLSGLQTAFEQAKKDAKSFGDHMKDALKDLGKDLVELFALEKIGEFMKDGVKKFAEFEKSFQLLGNTIKRTGVNFDGIKENMENYLVTAAKTTRFNKQELTDSLTHLVTLTGDYNQSLALQKKAMDFAVGTGKTLEESTTILGLAARGNSRGMLQMAKAMGVTGDAAKDNHYLFDQLDTKFKDMAATEGNTSTEMHKAQVAIDELAEKFGKALAPAIISTSQALVKFLGLMDQTGGEAKKKQAEIDLYNNKINAQAQYEQDSHTIGEAMAKRKYDATLRQLDMQYKGETKLGDAILAKEKAETDAFQAKTDTKIKLTNEENKLLKATIDSQMELINKRVKIETVGFFSLFSNISKESKIVTQGAKEDIDAFKLEVKKAEEEEKQMAEALAATIKKFSEKMSGEVATNFQKFVVDMKAGTAQIGDAFQILGKSIAKALVTALAEGLLQQGVAYAAKGVADLISYNWLAAEGDFAAGVSISAAGGTMMGVADAYLAQGGIVTKPTLSMVGEGGQPEAVIPLDRAGDFGFGSGGQKIGDIHINNYGVKDFASFNGASTRASMARQQLDVERQRQRRSGLRG